MRILSQGTKPAHKWIPDRRTSHPSIPPLCFLWILYACRVRREDQLHPMWQVPRDSHDLATGDVHVGRPRPNPTEDRSSPTWLFSSSSSSHTNSLPLCYSPPPCSPSKPPSVPSLYHLAYILPLPTYGVAMPIRRPCQTTPSIRARHRLTGILHRSLTLERERDDRIP